MAQHDMDVANQGFAAFRADMNAAFLALVGNSSGTSAPSTPFAHQFWVDTTNSIRYRRSGAGVWKLDATAQDTVIQSKSADYTYVLGDFARLTRLTGATARTFTPLAPATAGEAWWTDVRNDANTGIRLTITPASGNIDGLASIKLESGESCRIWCDGANYFTLGRMRGWIPIQTITAAGAAFAAFTANIDSTYTDYKISITDLLPATNAINLNAQVSQDNGSTWKSAAASYGYAYNLTTDAGANSPVGSNSATEMKIAGTLSNISTQGTCGEIRFWNPAGTAVDKRFAWDLFTLSSAPQYMRVAGGGSYVADQLAMNGVKIYCSSGNLSGRFVLSGYRD